jgi:hypothetical protein
LARKVDPAIRYGIPMVVAAFLGLALGRYLYLQPAEVGRFPELSGVGAPAAGAGPVAPSSVEAAPGASEADESAIAALPPLDQSDVLVRELVGQLSSHPTLAAWLATDGLIRTFAGVVANVAQGDSPAPFMWSMAPREKFSVRKTEGGLIVDPRSYRRYDRFAAAFASLDVEGTAQLYARLRPLLARAYRDLGYEDSFHDALVAAMRRLLETPVIEGPTQLTPRLITFEFADADLEQLDAAQRHFLRMGPANVQRIQTKLRELAPALDVPDGQLPATFVSMGGEEGARAR